MHRMLPLSHGQISDDADLPERDTLIAMLCLDTRTCVAQASPVFLSTMKLHAHLSEIKNELVIRSKVE